MIGVEQQDRDAANHHPPGADAYRAPGHAHRRKTGIAARAAHRLERRRRHVEALVGVLLPAVEPQPLVRIAVGIEQADADERSAQVRRRLAMVACEQPQAARVDRHRAVQAELGAEVGDSPLGQVGVRRFEPGVVGRGHPPIPLDNRVVAAQKGRVLRACGEPGGIHPAQQLDGIVPREVPERLVDRAEQLAGVAVPAPRQVGGQRGEPCDPFGEGGTPRSWLSHPACKLRPGRAAWEAREECLRHPHCG